MSSLGSRLGFALESTGNTVEWLARALDVSPSTVYRWVAGDAAPYPKNLDRIASAIAVRAEWLRTGEGTMDAPPDSDTKQSPEEGDASAFARADLVPIYDHATVEAAATPDGIEIDAENATGLIWMPRALVRDLFGVDDPSRVRRITVTGSSMYPTLMPGQKIWVVQAMDDNLPVSGAVYLVRGPYGLFVKRLIVGSVPVASGGAREYRVTLVSDNADKERYADETFPLETFRRDFAILGHVPRVETAL